ncbi:sugar kinase [Oryzifoliimicrobium ureilyticus]|uniref:sugar kinase n=1 Tax=Oryzifoliimicrobium ureilyticus TaxID=3113724 RepID=UPI003076475C
MSGRFLSIGECMVELSQAGDSLLRKGFAGDTLNTAWYARACLTKDWRVDYFTALGDEAMSDEMAAFFDKNNIGTQFVRRIRGKAPGLYMISLRDGERSFSYWRDSSAARQLADDPDQLRNAIEASDIIYFSGITLAILSADAAAGLLAEVRRAKAAGKLVAFDPNIRPRLWSSYEAMHATITEGARSSVMVMPSFDDEAMHFGDASVEDTIHRYKSLGAKSVIVKNGAAGALVDCDGKSATIPAVPVEKPVDTTSAGDSFNGAFLARYVETKDASEAARFAAGIAARVICEHGALIAWDKLGLPAA